MLRARPDIVTSSEIAGFDDVTGRQDVPHQHLCDITHEAKRRSRQADGVAAALLPPSPPDVQSWQLA